MRKKNEIICCTLLAFFLLRNEIMLNWVRLPSLFIWNSIHLPKDRKAPHFILHHGYPRSIHEERAHIHVGACSPTFLLGQFIVWEKHDINIGQSAFVVVLLSNKRDLLHTSVSPLHLILRNKSISIGTV
jgi:hypothetical protein